VIQIKKGSSKPIYEQVVFGVKESILHGALLPGDKIPSIREMANQLLLNPNTISKAYGILEDQDIIETVQGKGTFVKQTEPVLRNELDVRTLKKKLTELVIEAFYIKVGKEEMIQWIEEAVEQFGGGPNHDTDSEKS